MDSGDALSGFDVSRYDLTLLLIPTAFLLGLLVSYLFAVPPRTTLATASVVGALAVGDGLFRRPPRPRAAGGAPEVR